MSEYVMEHFHQARRKSNMFTLFRFLFVSDKLCDVKTSHQQVFLNYHLFVPQQYEFYYPVNESTYVYFVAKLYDKPNFVTTCRVCGWVVKAFRGSPRDPNSNLHHTRFPRRVATGAFTFSLRRMVYHFFLYMFCTWINVL